MSEMAKVEFKFRDENRSREPKTILSVLDADVKVVTYVDGEGKEQTRLCHIVRGQQGGLKALIVQERISGTLVVTQAHSWFNDGVKAYLDKDTEVGSI